MNAGKATGDAVAQILKEIEEGSNLGNLYCLSGTEVEQNMTEMRQRMADIRMNIETLWTKSPITDVQKPLITAVEKPSATAVQKSSSTVEFRDRIVSVSDLAAIYSTVTVVSFLGCRSKE
jgi:hypothetical protein